MTNSQCSKGMEKETYFDCGRKGTPVRYTTCIQPKSGYNLLVSKKVGRNAPCRCGSGKKAKHCCGAETKYYSAKAVK
ncbi:SEC-C metal-binding domain-containing protein [uncultured Rikenella sp.]|uniref:SEC-C metal-binding domain-containing protein n=1 Tax=uncultured Rikenella sp. TaxID=368003 RepID=UPI00345BF404